VTADQRLIVFDFFDFPDQKAREILARLIIDNL